MFSKKLAVVMTATILSASMLVGFAPVSKAADSKIKIEENVEVVQEEDEDIFTKQSEKTSETDKKKEEAEAEEKKAEETSKEEKVSEEKKEEKKETEMVVFKAGSKITNENFSITLPSGFSIEKSDNGGVYARKKSGAENIVYVVSEGTGSISAKTLAKELKNGYPSDAEVKIEKASSVTFGSVKGSKIVVDVKQGAYEFTQTVVVVPDGEKVHVVTFTEDKDGGYANAFTSSAQTISISN